MSPASIGCRGTAAAEIASLLAPARPLLRLPGMKGSRSEIERHHGMRSLAGPGLGLERRRLFRRQREDVPSLESVR